MNKPLRDENGRLLPGQTANPKGRPSLPAEIREAIKQNGAAGVARMNQILSDDTAFGKEGWLDTKTQVKLAEVAMVRAFGSAAQAPIGAGAAEAAEDVQAVGHLLRSVYEAMRESDALPEFIKAKQANSVEQQEDTTTDPSPEPETKAQRSRRRRSAG